MLEHEIYSFRCCINCGEMVYPVGYMGSAWCIADFEGHYKNGNAYVQPLQARILNEEGKEINSRN